jgi:hypothetical protein
MVSDDEIHLSLGAKFKMVLNYTDNLLLYPNVIDEMVELTQSIEIEFDPTNP